MLVSHARTRIGNCFDAGCRRLRTYLGSAAVILALPCLITQSGADESTKAGGMAIDLSRLDGEILVRADDTMTGLNDFSFDMSVRYDGAKEGHIFSFYKERNGDGFYFKIRDDNRLELAFGKDGGISNLLSPQNLLETRRWYRLSGVKSGNTARLFIDGQEVQSGEVIDDIVDSQEDFRIGRSGHHSAAMHITRFRFWQDVLSAEQIAALGSDGDRMPRPSPLLDYDFAEGNGERIGNNAGPNYNARINAESADLGWVKAARGGTPTADRSANDAPLSAGDAVYALNLSDAGNVIDARVNAESADLGSVRAAGGGTSTADRSAGEAFYALNLSDDGNVIVVEDLSMPGPGKGFAVQLDLMFDDLKPGVIAHAESENGAFFSIAHDANHLWFTLGDGREQDQIRSPAGILEAGQWITLTASQDDGVSSLLVNGIRVASFRTPSGIDGSPMRLSIGDGDPAAAAFHLGAIDVWGRTLGTGEASTDLDEPVDLSDQDLLFTLGPWERQPQGRILEQRTGRGPTGNLEGDPADAWIGIDPKTMRKVSSSYIQLALAKPDGIRKAVVPRAEDEVARRRAALDDLLDIAQGQSRIMTLAAPADTVIVDDANIATAEILSPRKIYLFGEHAGRTTIRALDEKGEIVEQATIRVGTDVEAADQELLAIEGGGDNRFTDRGGRPALEGPADDVGEAMALAALADSPAIGDVPASNDTTIDAAQQVNIKVRFAEVSRNDLNQLGINWSALINVGVLEDAGASQFFLADSLLDAAGSAVGRIEAGDVNIDFLLEALQREGALSMLAEPNLTVLNGEEARFLAGGELPIPVPQDNSGATTVEFKPFGVSLDFRPVILGNNRISLQVASEVSDISGEGALQLGSLFVPAISVRRAETSLELASGQTFAVGGLFNRTISRNIGKIPGLGSIPILGALFRSTQYQRSETELVILITPYLVRPVDDPNKLALPGQGEEALTARRGNANSGTGFIVQ